MFPRGSHNAFPLCAHFWSAVLPPATTIPCRWIYIAVGDDSTVTSVLTQHADREISANSLIKTEHCRSIEVAVDEFGARHGERILDAILHGLPA
jgi:hypothetical protein